MSDWAVDMTRPAAWWMHPGQFWDNKGNVCEVTSYPGFSSSTYCWDEPMFIGKLWEWNWEHVVVPTFPSVWVVLAVLGFVASAAWHGMYRADVKLTWRRSWVSIPLALVPLLAGALWELVLVIGIVVAAVFGVWYGIAQLTNKGVGQARAARKAAEDRAVELAKKRRAALLTRAQEWDLVAKAPFTADEKEYRRAARVAAQSLRDQAEEVK